MYRLESAGAAYAPKGVGMYLPGIERALMREPVQASSLEKVASSQVDYSVLPIRISDIVVYANRSDSKDSGRTRSRDTPDTSGRRSERVKDGRLGDQVDNSGANVGQDRADERIDNIDGFTNNGL